MAVFTGKAVAFVVLISYCSLPPSQAQFPAPGGVCDNFDGGHKSQCGSVINTRSIYVPPSTTQREIDETAWDQTKFFLYPVLEKECTRAALRFICSTSFLECEAVVLNPSVPESSNVAALYVPPCQQTCLDFANACKQTLADAGQPPPPCELFPNSTTPLVFPMPWGFYNKSCTTVSGADDDDDYDYWCPEPFEYDVDDDDDEACDPPCPAPVYSDSEQDAIDRTIDVVNTLSMVACLVVIFTYLLDAKRRLFPYHLPIFVAFSAFGFHLGAFFLTAFGHGFVLCDSDPGLCTASGILMVYFAFALALWMIILIYNMAVTVYWKWKITWPLQILYHAIAWVLPAIPLTVALATSNIGAVAGAPYCFVETGDNGWPLMGIYAIPICVILFIGVIGVIIVLTALGHFAYRARRSYMRLLLKQWRVWAFALVFFYIYIFHAEESFRLGTSVDDLNDASESWGQCVFENGADEECDLQEEVEDAGLGFGNTYVLVLNTSLQGLLIALIFLTAEWVPKIYALHFRSIFVHHRCFCGTATRTNTMHSSKSRTMGGISESTTGMSYSDSGRGIDDL